jgi:ubiquinone biosynthesis protein COQ9
MTDATPDAKTRLLDAALSHVPFDGWSEATFRAAVDDSGIAFSKARILYPRGALDMAVAFHMQGDARMEARLSATDLSELRFRDRVAAAVRFRLEVVEDAEIVRRGTTLFALPQHAAEGARLIWGTADAIWTALGDTSDDVNWYTKRATLSGVYGATVLFWLGDESPGHQDTWAFLDRRIEDVMQIEKAKAAMRDHPILSRAFAGPAWVLGQIKAPARAPRVDLPGHWTGSSVK